MGVDVLIITALPEEFDAVEAVQRGAVGDWAKDRDSSGFRYRVRDYETEGGGRLQVALAQAVKMGGEATMEAASRLMPEVEPRCLAMCGICAGWRGKVSLGDVIVADRVYRYDDGKMRARESEPGIREREILSDVATYNLDARWKQAAEHFPEDWIAPLLEFRPPTLYQCGWDRAHRGGAATRHGATRIASWRPSGRQIHAASRRPNRDR